jgi:hypothetical protein
LIDDLLGSKIIENSLRGYWCEQMLAETLGPECKVISSGWHPWDLQIGPDQAEFPERIRIQVKNSAARQTWHGLDANTSRVTFDLPYRRIPAYFARQFPETICEAEGFLCDIFALCYHPVWNIEEVDQTDPAQWLTYLLPSRPEFGAITEAEYRQVKEGFDLNGKRSSLQRRPNTMELGIRGRKPIRPISVKDLTIGELRRAATTA